MADVNKGVDLDDQDRGGESEFVYNDGQNVAASKGPTPSQTVGPFFAYGLTPGAYGYAHKDIHSPNIIGDSSPEGAIVVEGQIFDGQGQSIHDAMVELVQADSLGHYATARRNDGFTGFGRCGTGANGPAAAGGDTHFRFHTIKPGATGCRAAPFLTLIIFMRGLLNHCITRVYFPEDEHEQDPVMRQVPQARRSTLVARKTAANRYRFDVHMQGENETVFFDI